MTMHIPGVHRVSQTKLFELRKALSTRDCHILTFLNRHRYATTSHLRRMFFIDHATQNAATRATVRVLDRLLGERLVARLDRRVGGSARGSCAFIWYLDAAGERLTRPANAHRRRFADPSTLFLDHSLEITDAHVRLAEAVTEDGHTLSRVEIEHEASRTYMHSSGATRVLQPDLFVTISTAEYDDHWYLEIDRGTESLPVLLAKCRAYAAYRRTGRAQTEHGVFPRVLWVLPTVRRVARLAAATASAPDLPNRLFTCVTPDQLIATIREPPDP